MECSEEAHTARVSGAVGKGRPSGTKIPPCAARDAAFKAGVPCKEGVSQARQGLNSKGFDQEDLRAAGNNWLMP